MKRILAIAWLTCRESVRSGAALSLLCLTLAAVGWLALTLQGDGTLTGQAEVFLRYACGVTIAILGLASLWLGAGRIASEVDDRTIQTLVVKPVHAADVWIGKWLGLVLMNAALLAAVSCVVVAGVVWILHNGGANAPDLRDDARRRVMVCRTPLAPVPGPDTKTGDCPSCGGDGGQEDDHHRTGRIAHEVVPPGGSRAWNFNLPSGGSSAFWLQFAFDYGSAERLPMQGVWSLTKPGATNALWTKSVSGLSAGRHRIEVRPQGPVSGTFALAFTSAPAPETGVIVFRPGSAAAILVGESGMPAQLFRAMLIALFKLSVLAAAGLSCSALFSTPVATFAATSLAVATVCVQYFLSIPAGEATPHSCAAHGDQEDASRGAWYQVAADFVTRAVATVLEPAHSLDGIGPVSDGLTVPWTLVGRAAIVLLGGYVLVLAALGVVALRRRELAGP
jgi:hypothetical protein